MGTYGMVGIATLILAIGACGNSGHGREAEDVDDADAGGVGEDAGTHEDAGPGDPSVEVFSLDRVHQIRIDLDAVSHGTLAPGAPAVSCTLTFDGEDVPEARVAIDGATGLGGKASFALGFGARFHALYQLDLDAGSGDPSMLRDHVGLEIWRRAGLVAPRTAFAAVLVDGDSYGLYEIRERVDEDFLERSFGSASGNLYDHPGGGELAVGVTRLVDNGGPLGDTTDLDRLATFTAHSPDGSWMTGLGDAVDTELFLRAWAVDALAVHAGGYLFGRGATWLYDRDRRFVFVPKATHDLFRDPLFDVDTPPTAWIGRRTWEHADGHPAYEAALRAVFDEAWDADSLIARLDAADALVADEAAADPRSGVGAATRAADVESIRAFLAGRGAYVREALDAVCGDGVVSIGENCDDGNTARQDGCDANCEDEFCGDGIVSTGEWCDDPGCLADCSGTFVCGDGVMDPGEACDPSDVTEDDGCTSRCALDACGDGIVQPTRGEACDGPGCRPDCSAAGTCGDGTTDIGEDCDDMNADDTDGCLSDCSLGDCVQVEDASGAWAYCTAPRTFDDAIARCWALGGDLGVPGDAVQNAVVSAETLARLAGPWWIGGDDRRVDGAWRDASGAPIVWLNFGPDEPNGGVDQNCVVVESARFDGGWNDKSCGQPYPIVCRLPRVRVWK